MIPKSGKPVFGKIMLKRKSWILMPSDQNLNLERVVISERQKAGSCAGELSLD